MFNQLTNQTHAPSVSIVIPSYNRRHWIERAVQSVTEQSYENIVEIIVVDDGSQDDTCAFLKSNHPDIKVIENEKNSGACFSRNRGAEAAQGEYIAFLDSDDQFHRRKIELQINEISKAAAFISTCAFEDDIGKIACNTDLSNSNIHSILKYRNCLGGSSALLIKKSLFLDHKFNETFKATQDWELFFRLSKQNKIIHLTTPLYHYGIVSNDRITSNSTTRYQGHKQLYEMHLKSYFISKLAFFFLLNALKQDAKHASQEKVNIAKWLYVKMTKLLR